jgi:hypothetical protein
MACQPDRLSGLHAPDAEFVGADRNIDGGVGQFFRLDIER